MERRQFFQQFSPQTDVQPTDPHQPTPTTGQPVVRLQRRAMACLFEIVLPLTISDRSSALSALDLIDELERELTIYRPNSTLSQLNRAVVDQRIPVSPRLFALLQRCQRYTQQTLGAFDISAGALIDLWRRAIRERQLPTPTAITAAQAQRDMSALCFQSRTEATNADQVWFCRPNVQLNLGAIGKGFALDEAATLLERLNCQPVLLSAGHSSMRVLNSPTMPRIWEIQVRDPRQREILLGVLRLQNGALSTSGVGEQFVELAGQRWGHVIDPRTGYPGPQVWQVTVTAPTAEEAEMLSTACVLLAADWIHEYCKRHPQVGVLRLLPEPAETDTRQNQDSVIDHNQKPLLAECFGAIDFAHFEDQVILS